MPSLREQSIAIIRQYQAPSGAYVASPRFDQYKYCWLRDGTFIAHAMDLVGLHDSARRFFNWIKLALGGQEHRVESLKEAIQAGRPLAPDDFLPARYHLDGRVENDGWPNSQLDGYGTWLWGLARHLQLTGDAGFLAKMRPGIELTLDYLKLCWRRPNYDCWEEFGDRRHPATLACLSGGLTAINLYLQQEDLAALAVEIEREVLAEAVVDGRFVKSYGNPSIDASLLWLSVPFGLVEPEDPLMSATVAEIERRLHHRGVHRYPGDTYYGGGEWILLAAWLGWYYCRVGRREQAAALLAWIESCADDHGELPEQVLDHVNAPERIAEWEARWGKVAKPLLWSHAMYLILTDELAQKERGPGGESGADLADKVMTTNA